MNRKKATGVMQVINALGKLFFVQNHCEIGANCMLIFIDFCRFSGMQANLQHKEIQNPAPVDLAFMVRKLPQTVELMTLQT